MLYLYLQVHSVKSQEHSNDMMIWLIISSFIFKVNINQKNISITQHWHLRNLKLWVLVWVLSQRTEKKLATCPLILITVWAAYLMHVFAFIVYLIVCCIMKQWTGPPTICSSNKQTTQLINSQETRTSDLIFHSVQEAGGQTSVSIHIRVIFSLW